MHRLPQLGFWNSISNFQAKLAMFEVVFNTFTAGLIQVVCANSSCLHVSLHGYNYGAECARELFKPSKDSASLWVCNEIHFFGYGFQIFCEWHHKWSSFRPFWPTSSDPMPKPLDGNISLMFLSETRLKSKSFDTLDDLLEFRVE